MPHSVAQRPDFSNFVLKLHTFRLPYRVLGILNHGNAHLTGEKRFVDKILPDFVVQHSPITVGEVGADEGTYEDLVLSRFNRPNVFV